MDRHQTLINLPDYDLSARSDFAGLEPDEMNALLMRRAIISAKIQKDFDRMKQAEEKRERRRQKRIARGQRVVHDAEIAALAKEYARDQK